MFCHSSDEQASLPWSYIRVPPPTLEKPIPQMTNYMIFTNLFQKEGSIVYLDA